MAAASTCGAVLAQAREVRIGHLAGEHSPAATGALAWAETVERATGNAFAFRQIPAAAAASEADLVDGLWAGRVDAVLVSPYALRSLVPALGVVDIPFVFRDPAHARAVLDSPFGQELLGQLRVQGLMALAWGEQGFRQLGNRRRPVHGPEDLAGLKFGVADNPLEIQTLRALGASPVVLPWAELATTLEHGRVDGQDQPLSVFMAAGLWRVQPHLTLTAHAYAPLVLVVAPGFWSSLNDLQKAAFTQGARKGAVATRRFVDETEKGAMDMLRANGVQIATDVDLAAFRAALAPLTRQQTGRFGAQTLEQIARVR